MVETGDAVLVGGWRRGYGKAAPRWKGPLSVTAGFGCALLLLAGVRGVGLLAGLGLLARLG
ncbi:hypothetical protein, partial [Streptomyces sp. AC04842]|uniref:hypothetical protein n=1 Tax=Streptomyces sp. AC04842 TaxID=2775327 RepID=UPI0020C731D3